MLTNQFLILDLLTALWVSVLFVILFIWLPTKSFDHKRDRISDRLVGASARILLATVAGVWCLTALGLFNWFTLMLLYVGCLLGIGPEYHWQVRKQIKVTYQRLLLVAADFLDPELALQKCQQLRYKIWFTRQQFVDKICSSYLNNLQGMMFILGLTVILSFTAFLRFEHPLVQLRFGDPDSYHTLLVTREILARDWSQIGYLPIMPSLAAILSLLGAIEPMQVIRFQGAILGFLLVLSVGYNVLTLTKNGTAALVAMFSLGIYIYTWSGDISPDSNWWQQIFATVTESLNQSLIRQWTGGELEIGAIFLVCALARSRGILRGKQQKTALIDTICCLAIVAIASPPLLIIAVFGKIGLWLSPKMSLAIATITWVLLAFAAAIPPHPFYIDRSFLLTLPVALSLLCGLFFALVTSLARSIFGNLSETVCLFLFFSISINCLLPPESNILYLEYEMAARKTLELEALFPTKKWALVAPVEQFAQTYGKVWYEDLGRFVEKYSAKAGAADFHFPFSVPDLFIFVEKIPFATYPTEPQKVSEAMLYDPVYRYYRSNTGRASLQFNALKMCEDYRQTHANTSIYYENNELRIYHFRLARS